MERFGYGRAARVPSMFMDTPTPPYTGEVTSFDSDCEPVDVNAQPEKFSPSATRFGFEKVATYFGIASMTSVTYSARGDPFH